MRVILNVIWLVFAGFWLAVGYALAGIIAFILIITIPFGFAALQDRCVRPVAVRPQDHPSLRRRRRLDDRQHLVDHPVRLVAGARASVTGIALCLTLIGIPLGLANFKLIPVSLTPLGREIVSTTNREFV